MTLHGKHVGLLTASASRAGGGVFEAVVRHAAMVAAAGARVSVFALRDPYSEADRERFGAVPVHHAAVCGPAQVGFAPALPAMLAAAGLDLLHLHGIWMYPSHAGARWAGATRRPYLISPHGMLDPWIVARGRGKKALARWGYERRSWARAALLHALTQDEAADIARESGRRDAAVMPNAAPRCGPARVTAPPAYVYLGRIHPKKNVAALVAAWAKLAPTQATLTIAGWGEPAHVRAVTDAVAAAACPSVRFVGPVHGADRDALLAGARWLVLPSLSEGLPMVVLEGWAAGTPTLMTPACHLPQGFAAGAAMPCGDTPAAIATALAAALAEDDAAWRRRSAAAQALAGGAFSGDTVAACWTGIYAGLMR